MEKVVHSPVVVHPAPEVWTLEEQADTAANYICIAAETQCWNENSKKTVWPARIIVEYAEFKIPTRNVLHQFVFATANQDFHVLKCAPKLLYDRVFMIAAARQNGLVYQLVTEDNPLRSDEEVATVAVIQNRQALRYIDQIIKGVVQQAVAEATSK